MIDALQVYVINLDRAPDRRAFMQTQLAEAGLTAIRVAAVDARRDLAEMQARRGFPTPRDGLIEAIGYEGKPYVIGDEACFQSHLKTLEIFLESDAAFALVLEDDVMLDADCAATLAALLGKASLWDAVRLEGLRKGGRRLAMKLSGLPGGRLLVASMRHCWGSAAYLISRKGAERLLRRGRRRLRPYDGYIGALPSHGLRFLDCSPFPIRQADLPSNIQRGKRVKPAFGQGRLKAIWRHVRADQIRTAPRWIVFPVVYWRYVFAWTRAPW